MDTFPNGTGQIWTPASQAPLILLPQEKADRRCAMELKVRQLCSSTLQSPGDSPRMANVLWPWLLLHLKPAAHGPALPLLLQTLVGVVRMIPEGGRLPLASRCGKGNRGCWSSPRATLPQDLLAQLLVLGASSYMTVQVRRASMFPLFQLISMFQAGSSQFWDNYRNDMLLYMEGLYLTFIRHLTPWGRILASRTPGYFTSRGLGLRGIVLHQRFAQSHGSPWGP
ncbi:unnamed protein product [Eretmochelys imbricata]